MSAAAFVLDCSIAMAWLFRDETTPKTAALLNQLATDRALVPAWWFVEITNVLSAAEHKGRRPGADEREEIAHQHASGGSVGAGWPSTAISPAF